MIIRPDIVFSYGAKVCWYFLSFWRKIVDISLLRKIVSSKFRMCFRNFVEKSSNFRRSVAKVRSKYRAIIRRKIARTKPEFRRNSLSLLLHSTASRGSLWRKEVIPTSKWSVLKAKFVIKLLTMRPVFLILCYSLKRKMRKICVSQHTPRRRAKQVFCSSSVTTISSVRSCEKKVCMKCRCVWWMLHYDTKTTVYSTIISIMLILQSMFLLDDKYSRPIQSGIDAQKIHMNAKWLAVQNNN